MWQGISNFGDATLTLPAALTCTLWLALSNRRQALRWIVLLSVGMLFVGATKILYAGCGTEFSQFSFRVVSGHTMLATSIWTVTLSILWQSFRSQQSRFIAPGLIIGAVIALVRVIDHSHTVSEVVAGWIVGAAIACSFLRRYHHVERTSVSRRLAASCLFLVSGIAYGHYAPIQRLIDTHSPGLCEYSRQELTGNF
jgi:membrane-associated phospholipid phosphatase